MKTMLIIAALLLIIWRYSRDTVLYSIKKRIEKLKRKTEGRK